MGGTEGARGIDGGKGRKKKKRWMDETINTATKEEGRERGRRRDTGVELLRGGRGGKGEREGRRKTL